MILQFLANGLCSGSLFAIVALGFGLIYNTTSIFHFAHGAVYVSSVYLFYLFLIILKLNVLISFILAILIGGILGVLIELVIYRPMTQKNTSLTALMIGSFGVYLFVVNLIAMLTGNETKVLSPGIEKTFTFGSVILTRIQILSVVSFLAIFLLFILFTKTKYGRVILAYSNNPKLVEILGWNSSKIKIFVFFVGSVLAGVSACLSGLDVGIDPQIGMNALLTSAVSVIIGGVKKFEGAIVGGLLIGLLQSLVVWQFSARWMEAFTFIVLILFLIFRPQGLLGVRARVEEI